MWSQVNQNPMGWLSSPRSISEPSPCPARAGAAKLSPGRWWAGVRQTGDVGCMAAPIRKSVIRKCHKLQQLDNTTHVVVSASAGRMHYVHRALALRVEPTRPKDSAANARGLALVLRGFALRVWGEPPVLGALHSAPTACGALLARLRRLGAAHCAPGGMHTCSGRLTGPAGRSIRYVSLSFALAVSMHTHYRSLSRGVAPGLRPPPVAEIGSGR